MKVLLEKIILEVSEREARLLGFAVHEYIWSQARRFKEQHPEGTWEGFINLNKPYDHGSNDMFEMWSLLARFWKQESMAEFEKKIMEELKINP